MAQKNYELQGGKGSLRLEMPTAASGLSPERPSPGRGASPRQCAGASCLARVWRFRTIFNLRVV